MKGRLYLIPTTLGGEQWEKVVPNHVATITRSLRYFIAEDVRTARRYLSRLGMSVPIDELVFDTLNEHSTLADVHHLMFRCNRGLMLG